MSTHYIDKFFGGIIRDDKSIVPGAGSNFEEFDIFEDANYIIPTQIMSAEASFPSGTEVYAYTADYNDVVYGYGKETSGGKVRIVSVAGGGGTSPGAFSTLMTSADGTNLAYLISPIEYHKTSESNKHWLYYLTNASGTILLRRCQVDGTGEATVGTLTGLTGTFDRVSFRHIFGELFVVNGNFIAKVDKDGVFTEKAFTLPTGWNAVDLCELGTNGLILARNINRLANYSKAYFWDLTDTTSFTDSFDVPFGGPQWIQKHREKVKLFFAINGKAWIYELSGAWAGAVPSRLKGIEMRNIATETSTQPISSSRQVSIKDDVLYFNVWKTDKSGIYALGQLDTDKPTALVLAKRFHTSSYATHTPYALLIQGTNFYASFSDNGTFSAFRCMTANGPTRSSNAVYETITLDEGNPTTQKKISEGIVITQPLPANTSISLRLAMDYGSYVGLQRANGTNYQGTGNTNGLFKATAVGKTLKLKVMAVSDGTSAVKIVGIGYTSQPQGSTARK